MDTCTCLGQRSMVADDTVHERTVSVLRDLAERYPSTPFLALGQTVWWDEPMKAVLLLLMEEAGLSREMVFGVHDTDYFAKLHMPLPGHPEFELLPHNDGSTRDLWSAAGEISRLFGSECYPTRQDLTRYGVPLRTLARTVGMSVQALLDEHTDAWGWRGLVHTRANDTVVCELRLADISAAIRAMLEYGFRETVQAIETPSVREHAEAVAQTLFEQCCRCCRETPDATLPDLYKHMIPHLLGLMLGRDCVSCSITSTAELLRLTPASARLPRFRLLDVFLDPETRSSAAEAYNDAVSGSEIYTLDKFGLGALPFDVIVPGYGRGTLRVTLRAVHIDARRPLRIRTTHPVRSAEDLANVLAEHLPGPPVVVGKAVTLVAMLASEFLFVFNEEGSAYVSRTRAMNENLAARGIHLSVHPILRLRYPTWDTAATLETRVKVPEPMEAAFGASVLPMDTIACRWREVVRTQEALLKDLEGIRGMRQLLAFLAARCPGRWKCAARRYSELSQEILEAVDAMQPLAAQCVTLQQQLAATRREIASLESEMGRHFRSVAVWTDTEKAHRASLQGKLTSLHAERRKTARELRRCRARLRAAGRESRIESIRSARHAIATDANLERMRLVRDAILTARGLTHTNHRPTAWWIPMLDPSGEWFRRIARSVEAYIEPLSGE